MNGDLPAHETKTKQAVFADLPASLTPHLDYWLDTARPVLLGRKHCRRPVVGGSKKAPSRGLAAVVRPSFDGAAQ